MTKQEAIDGGKLLRDLAVKMRATKEWKTYFKNEALWRKAPSSRQAHYEPIMKEALTALYNTPQYKAWAEAQDDA